MSSSPLPSALAALVLVLAAFRVTRLIGWDDLPPIEKLRAKLTGAYVYQDSTMSRDTQMIRYKRPLLAHFIACPYCLGFWISLLAYGLWLAYPRQMLYVAVPFAISGAVGIVGRMLDP